ncbi:MULTISPECIES: heme-degrading domain-containing protein [unclassified Mycolicibacterium]|uniref:heme-degrading domain-containing protein n=1 Tax=unclassified Mycolicibacterium TaxID=2636767 RepID=UPI002EDA28D1
MTESTIDWQRLHATVIAEENALGFQRFGHADAWALGSAMVATATAQGYPVAIAISFGEQRVFHAALAGSSATNDDWLDRKFRAVAKHNCSSWALACSIRAAGADYFTEGGYRREDIAPVGGAVPLRVQGSLIGAVGVSGLAEDEDHRFVVDALRAFRG